ncbi:RNA-binding domain-containing protein [Reichenbachiella sp. MALMAid0571]|uniref:RNA-binding domain-containing protein n=1 Tax=Reichenbachiella sp. MALMAid0571 TaxID=3143939 RepID=UPI0032E003D1
MAKREGESLEFKSSFNRSVIETLVGFANTRGGKIVIGVSDKKEIIGISVGEESVQKWINEIKQHTKPSVIPDVEVIQVEGNTVVVMEVQEFPIKPVSFNGRYYSRKQNSNHLLSLTEINDLYTNSLQTSWDSYPWKEGQLEDINMQKVEAFIQRVNENKRFSLEGSPIDCLSKLRLIKENRPTNAAMLLFSKEDLFYNVHVGRFKTPTLVIADKMISGGLFEVLEETMQFIVSQIKVAFEITGESTRRNEIFEYPLTALRELVVNAIVHRDYTSPTDIQIKIFDQSISIFNPGKLFGGLTIEDLKTDNYQAQTRNKLIAEAFYLTKEIEKYGSGYRRVREKISQYPTMKFDFMENSGGYFVEISYKQQKTESKVIVINDPVNDPVNDRRNGILQKMEENKFITREQLADGSNVSVETIKRDIRRLRDQGKLKRIGSDKTGYWEVVR